MLIEGLAYIRRESAAQYIPQGLRHSSSVLALPVWQVLAFLVVRVS